MQQPTASSSSGRLEALDALRGMIILLMTLDHARMFVADHHHSFVVGGGAGAPLNPACARYQRFERSRGASSLWRMF